MTFKPQTSHIQWARNLIGSAGEGATWGIPRSGVVFRIEKANKRLVQIEGPENGEDLEVHRAVFGAVGFDVCGYPPKTTESKLKEHWTNIERKSK